ncbi:MAG: hypothetical protein SCABRO_00785 [Candidatus Scalindua brodae]|uniref:Uncharacterized protein n=1 Tax=Candidatus Scalindua brodae TaxID=237368 RepID=A0A0B0ES37_9BACT|nr:MAG: hypothetical protein SCABRO_00785 [Candidatus Scalindua brodae]
MKKMEKRHHIKLVHEVNYFNTFFAVFSLYKD